MVNWPLRRIILSAFANRYIRAVTGLDIRDCTSGFRCWRREALAKVPLDRVVSDGYAFLTEMLYEAHVRGARIGEVPIVFVERRMGTSKLSGGVLLESALTPWRLRLRICSSPAMTARQRVVMVATSYPTVSRRHRGHLHGADRQRAGRARARGAPGAALASALAARRQRRRA